MRFLEWLFIILIGALILGIAYFGLIIDCNMTEEKQAEIMERWGE